MTFKNYLKDHSFSLFLCFFMLSLLIIILWVFQCPLFLIYFLPSLIFVFISIIIVYEYRRKCSFYHRFEQDLSRLDEKYLITGMAYHPHFLEGKLLLEYLYDINKSMKEHLNLSLEKQKAWKEYIEMWVHEVKTPLSTSFIVLENHPTQINESIKEELDQIDHYVEQVLYFVRSENVEKDYLIKAVSLKKIVYEAIKKNKKALIEKHVSCQLEKLDYTVYSDKKWLVYILDQIIHNALQYFKQDPKLTIQAIQSVKSVTLNIKDNGIGIKEDELSRVFDKGFTGSNGRTNKKSTGMGLYICKQLCIKMYHDIYITSTQDKTTVSIVIPMSSFVTLQ